MRLEEHISQLLFQHDCVIVPNFGAFISHRAPVLFHRENQTLTPPFKELSFNSALKKSDGILIQAIATQEQISFEQASIRIDEQVKFWEEHLRSGKFLALPKIGLLKLNTSEKIEFEPQKKINYLAESYGLQTVKANLLLLPEAFTKTRSPISKLLIASSIIPILVGGYLYFNTPQPVQKFVNEQWSGLVVPILNNVSPVDSTALDSAQLIYSIHNLPQTIASPSEIYHQAIDSINTAPEVTKYEITVVEEKQLNENEKEIKAIIKSETSTPTAKVKDEKTEKEGEKKDAKTVTNNKYQVIASSLRRSEDADRMLESLKKEGYKNARIVYIKGRYYYVTFDSFNTMEQASKYLNELHAKRPDAWIREQQ